MTKARSLALATLLALVMPGAIAVSTAADATPAKPVPSLEQLLNEVRQSRGAERLVNQEREQRFLRARDEQQALLNEARAQQQREEKRADDLRREFERNETRLSALETDLASRSGDLTDLFGVARQAAVEAQGSIKNSVVSVQFGDWNDKLGEVASRPHALSINDLETLWLTMLDATVENGRTVRFKAPVITAEGEELSKDVVRVGTFNAVADGRFLRYLPETAKLVELSRQPPARFTSMVSDLEESKEGFQNFPIDPSRGAILSLITHTPSLGEQIQKGGFVGYLLVALIIIGAAIVVYRSIVLMRVRRQVEAEEQSAQPSSDNPLGRLRLVAQEANGLPAESLLARLQERIGEEASLLHKGLRTIGVFAAVGPLLGLLGTVSGMIATFQSITLFGGGDPRVMSAGISEALVATELGLVVAIPALLAHSLLSGRANRLIEKLEHHSMRLMAAGDKGR